MALRGKLRRTKKREMPEADVNITALMDVLTVLLFFLIKSFTVTSSTINTAKGIRLPASMLNVPVADSVSVSLSSRELRVDEQLIATLSNGVFRSNDIAQDGRTISKLYKYLRAQLDKRNAIYADQGDVSFLPDAKIQIQADRKIPFSQMKQLLHTVSASGYTNYQFVVSKEDQ